MRPSFSISFPLSHIVSFFQSKHHSVLASIVAGVWYMRGLRMIRVHFCGGVGGIFHLGFGGLYPLRSLLLYIVLSAFASGI